MKKPFVSLLLLMVIISVISVQTFAQNIATIEEIMSKIDKAEKVEQLYNARYNLDKLSANPELPVTEFRMVLEAHLKLTEAFKTRNHFRNAAIVYLDYLRLADNFHEKYSKFLTDSIDAAGKAEIVSLKNEISGLNSEIEILTKRNIEVSGLRSKYFTFGGFATAIILAVFIVVFVSRNRAIKANNSQIENSNIAMRDIFRNSVNTAIVGGTILHAKHELIENAALAGNLLADAEKVPGLPANSPALKALKELGKL